MSNKQGKRYSEEFKRDAVALARSSGKTVTEVARDLGVSPEGLRSWVKQDKADRGEGGPGDLNSAEHEELRRLRRQNVEQQKTIEVLKKATLDSTGQELSALTRVKRKIRCVATEETYRLFSLYTLISGMRQPP